MPGSLYDGVQTCLTNPSQSAPRLNGALGSFEARDGSDAIVYSSFASSSGIHGIDDALYDTRGSFADGSDHPLGIERPSSDLFGLLRCEEDTLPVHSDSAETLERHGAGFTIFQNRCASGRVRYDANHFATHLRFAACCGTGSMTAFGIAPDVYSWSFIARSHLTSASGTPRNLRYVDTRSMTTDLS